MATSTYRSIANAAFTATQSTIVISKPSGTVDGDLLVAFLVVSSGTARTITTLAGWTLVRTDTLASGSEVLACYQKIASSEGSSYTWSLSGTADWSAGAIIRCDTFDTTTPIDANNAAGTDGANTNSITFTDTVTPTLASELMFFPIYVSATGHQNLSGTNTQAVTTSNPSWTKVLDILGNISGATGSKNFSIAYANRVQTTATGNSSATAAGGTGPNRYMAQKIIIKNFTSYSSTISDTVVDTDSIVINTNTSSTISDTVVDTDSISATKDKAWPNQSKNPASWDNQPKT